MTPLRGIWLGLIYGVEGHVLIYASLERLKS